MDLYIDDNPVNVELQDEKTVGDFLASLQNLLKDEEVRITGLVFNGESVTASSLGTVFQKPLDGIETLAVRTESIAQLSYAALQFVSELVESLVGANETEKKNLLQTWQESPEKPFLEEQCPDTARAADGFFAGADAVSYAAVSKSIDSCNNEITEPLAALSSLVSDAEEVGKGLSDLALHVQMGKDKEAAKKILSFSILAQKIFRLLQYFPAQLKDQLLQKFDDENFLKTFASNLKDFLSAVESGDSVMEGDIAEYEIAPALTLFFKNTALLEDEITKRKAK
jgi:hypothetical protein